MNNADVFQQTQSNIFRLRSSVRCMGAPRVAACLPELTRDVTEGRLIRRHRTGNRGRVGRVAPRPGAGGGGGVADGEMRWE